MNLFSRKKCRCTLFFQLPATPETPETDPCPETQKVWSRPGRAPGGGVGGRGGGRGGGREQTKASTFPRAQSILHAASHCL